MVQVQRLCMRAHQWLHMYLFSVLPFFYLPKQPMADSKPGPQHGKIEYDWRACGGKGAYVARRWDRKCKICGPFGCPLALDVAEQFLLAAGDATKQPKTNELPSVAEEALNDKPSSSADGSATCSSLVQAGSTQTMEPGVAGPICATGGHARTEGFSQASAPGAHGPIDRSSVQAGTPQTSGQAELCASRLSLREDLQALAHEMATEFYWQGLFTALCVFGRISRESVCSFRIWLIARSLAALLAKDVRIHWRLRAGGGAHCSLHHRKGLSNTSRK